MSRRSRARFRKVKRATALLLALGAFPFVPHLGATTGEAADGHRAGSGSLVQETVDRARGNLRDALAIAANAPFAMLGLSERAEFRYVTFPDKRGEGSRGLDVLVRWRLGGRWNEVALTDPSSRGHDGRPSHSRLRAR